MNILAHLWDFGSIDVTVQTAAALICGVASTADFIGHVIALVVRVLIWCVSAGDQHHLEGVGIEVDGATRHVVDAGVVDEAGHDADALRSV